MYNRDSVLKETLKYFDGDTLAANVWTDKYCLKDHQSYYELTPDDMHKRIAKELARIEKNYINPLSEEEIYQLLYRFTYLVPQGSPMEGIGNNKKFSTLSNCYVIENPKDSYPGILYTETEMITLMKARGGVGFSLQSLRPRDMPTSSVSNKSSGLVLFGERYSRATKEVAQDGRRGALMLTCPVDHPDIEYFIDAKVELQQITNANISVMITDSFMKSVENESSYTASFRRNGSIFNKDFNAKGLWDKLIYNSWKCAEPGMLFWDNILRESIPSCYGEKWKETSTNPCFTGDTIIAVADGRNGVKISDLVDTEFFVYSGKLRKTTGNHKGGFKSEIKKARAFKTGVKEVVLVKLSDGSSFKCTEDHLLAKPDGSYIEAHYSEGFELEKFYTFSDKNTNKSYRHICSIYNGYSKQYRLMWEFFNSNYDGSKFNIDHINGDTKNDYLDNLQLLSINEHKEKSSESKLGKNNPIHKVNRELVRLDLSRKNIFANASRYHWTNKRFDSELKKWEDKNLEYFKSLKKEDSNIYMNGKIFVEKIEFLNEKEDVYDLSVEDNHNFYIITKTDDENFLNSSGILVHNCSELPLPPHDSCRLLAINLYSYVDFPFTEKAIFNYQKFIDHVHKAQRLMDDIIDLEIEKIDRILKKLDDDYTESEEEKRISRLLWNRIRVMALEGRRTGLGHTADADMLAALGYRFGTVEATDFIISIQKLLSVEAYKESIILAKERGCFPIWNREKEINNPFIGRILGELEFPCRDDYDNFGRRNIANLTIAPTGCLDKDVKIKTDRGLMSMEQIFNINGVNLNDLKNKKNVWFDCIEDISINNLDGSQNKIKKLYWNGITDGYRFIFEDNYSLFSSKVHRFLIKKSEKEAMWVSSDELKVGDKILLLQ